MDFDNENLTCKREKKIPSCAINAIDLEEQAVQKTYSFIHYFL